MRTNERNHLWLSIAGFVWEFELATPVTRLAQGRLTVSVKDRQGNTAQVVRTISVSDK